MAAPKTKTLAELIVESAPMPWERAVALLRQIATTLHTAHQQGRMAGILDPKTILIPETGDIVIPTRSISEGEDIEESEDTLPYLAPEYLRGETATPKTDQFSLAALFYEMITGQKPFESEDPVLLRHLILSEPPALLPADISIPFGAYGVLERALAKSPEERFDDILAFANALEALSTDETLSPPPSTRKIRRFVAAGIAILMVVAMAWLLSSRNVLVTAMFSPASSPTATEEPMVSAILPSSTPTSTATPTLDATPTVILASTAEGGGVAEPTATPTPSVVSAATLPPTPTPIPTPTMTPTPTSTPTPKPKPTRVKRFRPTSTPLDSGFQISLLEPAPGAEGQQFHLRWQAPPLQSGMAFEPVIWSSSDPKEIQQFGMSPTGMLDGLDVFANVRSIEGKAPLHLSPGHDYFWAVCIVQKDPFQRLWCSQGRPFHYTGESSTGDDNDGGGSCPPDC